MPETLPGSEPAEQADPRPTTTCPYCAETILAAARKCKHCGEWFEAEHGPPEAYAYDPAEEPGPDWGEVYSYRPRRQWGPLVAGGLSLLVPGLGQMFNGRVTLGLGWLAGAGVVDWLATRWGYLSPVIAVHAVAMIGAIYGNVFRD